MGSKPGNSRVVSTALVVFGVFWVLLLQVYPLIADTGRLHGNDFQHLYLAGDCVRDRDDFYDFDTIQRHRKEVGISRGINPFVYLPFTAVLFTPLSFTGPREAEFIWFGMNLVFLALSILFLSRSAPKGQRSLGAVFLLLAAGIFIPLQRTLTAGQLNLILLFFISLSIHAFSRKQWFLGGFWTGVAGMVKVSPFFLLIFLLWKRKWRAVLGGTVAIVALMIVTTAIMGPSYAYRSHTKAIPVFRQMGYGSSTWYEYGNRFHIDPGNVSPASVAYRLFAGDPGIEPRFQGDPMARPPVKGVVNSPGLAKGISILIGLSMIALLAWVTRRRNTDDPIPMEYSCAVITMLLVPSLMWDHYLILLFPMAMLFFLSSWSGYSIIFTLIWSLSLTATSLRYWFANPAYRNGWKTLLMSPQTFAVLAFYGAALWFVWKKHKTAGSGEGNTQT